MKKVSGALSLSRLTRANTHGGLLEETMIFEKFRKLHQRKFTLLSLDEILSRLPGSQ